MRKIKRINKPALITLPDRVTAPGRVICLHHSTTVKNLLDKVRIIEFPKICDPRGNLSFVESARHVPFSIKRVFYIYDVPGGETRGGHAHRECQIVLLALAGSFDVRLTDGEHEMTVRLNRANRGVLIPAGVWDTMHDFTTGSVALALASHPYEEEDYIRDYDEYLAYVSTLE